jgi:hypothetical protein
MKNSYVILVVLILSVAVSISGIYKYARACSRNNAVHKVCLALEYRQNFSDYDMNRLAEIACFNEVPTPEEAALEENITYHDCQVKFVVLLIEVAISLLLLVALICASERAED